MALRSLLTKAPPVANVLQPTRMNQIRVKSVLSDVVIGVQSNNNADGKVDAVKTPPENVKSASVVMKAAGSVEVKAEAEPKSVVDDVKPSYDVIKTTAKDEVEVDEPKSASDVMKVEADVTKPPPSDVEPAKAVYDVAKTHTNGNGVTAKVNGVNGTNCNGIGNVTPKTNGNGKMNANGNDNGNATRRRTGTVVRRKLTLLEKPTLPLNLQVTEEGLIGSVGSLLSLREL